jgi:hypothetical protein
MDYPQNKNKNLRKDLAIKGVLRKIRRYYYNKFIKMTSYTRCRRYKPISFFYECLVDYCEQEFKVTPSGELIFIIGKYSFN